MSFTADLAAWTISRPRNTEYARRMRSPVFCDARANVAFNDITRYTPGDLIIPRCSLTPYARDSGVFNREKYKRRWLRKCGAHWTVFRVTRHLQRKPPAMFASIGNGKKGKRGKRTCRMIFTERDPRRSRRMSDACVDCNVHSKKSRREVAGDGGG